MLKNTKLRNKLKKISGVKDIILFGSLVRGKSQPNDIDVLVLFKEKVDKAIEYEIRKIVEQEYENVSIISKTEKTLLDPAFTARESILFEGKSLLTKDTLSEKYGYSSLGMFKYDFKDWSKLQKTKFYYALNGRGKSKGISAKFDCVKLSDRIILVPLENIELFKEFLESWQIYYRYIPMLIPQRLSKGKFLE